ncbi:PAS domain-containing protein [Alsobacter sp. KACC 23698]|uniref:histidine kinase n=1 Tax=Alsobacter sp. KACC 23698 TaxID=3149229 RepID=A0AAU7J937_9HYPH
MIEIPGSESEFRLLADHAPVMVWRSGTDMGCDWFNEPWLAFTGRELQQELGEGWAENVHPDDVADCLDAYHSAFRRQEPFTIEYRLRRHDGQYRYVMDNGRPYYRDGEFAGYFGSCVDVTAHRQTEAQLVHALAERENLLRELHHRVRNNLQSVLALLRLTTRGADASGQALLSVLDRRVSAMALAQKSMQGLDAAGPIALRRIVVSTIEDVNAVIPDLSVKIEQDPAESVIQAEQASSFMLGMAEALAILANGRAGAKLTVGFGPGPVVRIGVAPGRADLATDRPSLLLIRQYARSAGFDSEPAQDGGSITFRQRAS